MKYFTKYLPVEGEIKIGDMVWDGRINPQPPDWPYYKVEEKDDIPPNHFPDKKVKLFLCSRDIQVGDEVTCINPKSVNFNKKAKHFEWGDTENWTKVIGEISPEATWVMEGAEIPEDFLKMIAEGNTTVWDFDPTFPSIKYILIKGPCGHFH